MRAGAISTFKFTPSSCLLQAMESSPPKKVFSFCLFGTESNYYVGLLENIKIIREFYPDFEIYVYKGACDASWVLPDVHVIETERSGHVNAVHRYLPLLFAETGFVRDADSRITARDRWCIDEFLKSNYSYHIIRDHFYHRSKIMAGMFGWKKPLNIDLKIAPTSGYGYDEQILAAAVYPKIVSNALVHTNISAFVGEHSERIKLPQKNNEDFVGNVVWNGVNKFTYFLDATAEVEKMKDQDQFGVIQFISDAVDPMSVPYHKRATFFDTCYIANFYLRDFKRAQYWLSQFEFSELTAHHYANAQYLLPHLSDTIVASFDPTYEPAEGEVVIYYGNYPDWHLALPCSNKIYRHVSKFKDTYHTRVDYNPAWEPVDIIYILNLEERVDRYYDTLLALCAIRAPLHRVHHYKAVKDDTPAYIGASQNHVDCMKHFVESKKEVCLILEDDFVFNEEKERIWGTLEEFWKTPLDYQICFLSLSKTGERQPHNSIVSRTKQPCTTSSGYFLKKSTVEDVIAVAAEGVQMMKLTGDQVTYCIDRYWSKLPDLFFFKTKFGFQRPCYSNLTRRVVEYLD
jgi:hypothetical protein